MAPMRWRMVFSPLAEVSPQSSISPASGKASEVIRRISVVLPAPFLPMRP